MGETSGCPFVPIARGNCGWLRTDKLQSGKVVSIASHIAVEQRHAFDDGMGADEEVGSACRIEIDVTANFKEVGVGVDEDGLEAPLEQMADLAEASVVGLSIHAVPMVHEPGKIRLTGSGFPSGTRQSGRY